MKRHTAPYYARRIEQRRSMAFGMGFKPNETNVLVLRNVSENGGVMIREDLMTDEKAIAMLVDGTALRVSVTNNERNVHLYIDPT